MDLNFETRLSGISRADCNANVSLVRILFILYNIYSVSEKKWENISNKIKSSEKDFFYGNQSKLSTWDSVHLL
jgi:hypothetical protein